MLEVLTTKVCTRCDIEKVIEEFYFLKWADRYGPECTECKNKNRRERSAKRRAEDPIGHEEQRKNASLKKHYGITLEEYEALHDKQDGKCAICHTPESQLNKSLAVDHDHDTGKVRGLLCINCNSILGHADDSIDTLLNSIKYLRIC